MSETVSTAKKDLVRRLFNAAVVAASPDDPHGHLPNCGYTEETPNCGCAAYGKRLYAAIERIVPSAESDTRRSLCLWCRKRPPMGDYLHARFICEECAASVTPHIESCRECGSTARGDEFQASGLCQACLCGPLPTRDFPPGPRD